MKYLLFVYPCNDTWDKKETNLKIAEELSTISKSDDITFVYGDNHAIFHFDSDMCQPELTIYIDLIYDESPDFMYVLVQTSKTITSNMLPAHLEHLKKLNKKVNVSLALFILKIVDSLHIIFTFLKKEKKITED